MISPVSRSQQLITAGQRSDNTGAQWSPDILNILHLIPDAGGENQNIYRTFQSQSLKEAELVMVSTLII